MFEKKNWIFKWYDIGVMLSILFGATMLCVALRDFSDDEIYVALVFVLCVMLVSLKTEGYLCGTIMSVISVVAVNYIFTYPYMSLNFSISGYPLTFVTMLTVALITGTLTTNLKREEELRMENERERLRANLLRAISHDLRTPLTSISGSVGVVLENESMTREEKYDLLAGVQEDANWLIRMVENLLSVTRVGLDSARIEKTMEVAEEVIYSVISKFRNRFPAVEVRPLVPDDVLLVPMDPVLIEQVLSNLLENAVIHGDATEIRLSVECLENMASFTVKDNGRGIDPNVLPKLFDDYYMLAEKEKGTGKKRSMGIGFSVCMSIVKAHGGLVNAYNAADGGACINFSLPMRED